MSTLGIECQSRQKVVRRRIGRPPLSFFFYFLMIVRPGRASLVLKEEEEEENYRRRGHPDLVTTYDCGFFFSFFISPRRFPPFAVEGKTRGSLSSTVVRQQSPSLKLYGLVFYFVFFCFIFRVAIRWGVHCTWAVQRGGFRSCCDGELRQEGAL